MNTKMDLVAFEFSLCPPKPYFFEKRPKKPSHSWGLYWVTSWVAPLLHHLFRHRLQAVRIPWVHAGRAPPAFHSQPRLMAVWFRAANSGLSRNNPLHWQMSRMWHDTIPGCSVSLPPLSSPNEGPGCSGFDRIHWPLLNIFPNGWWCSPATERETNLISFHINLLASRMFLRMWITSIHIGS